MQVFSSGKKEVTPDNAAKSIIQMCSSKGRVLYVGKGSVVTLDSLVEHGYAHEEGGTYYWIDDWPITIKFPWDNSPKSYHPSEVIYHKRHNVKKVK